MRMAAVAMALASLVTVPQQRWAAIQPGRSLCLRQRRRPLCGARLARPPRVRGHERSPRRVRARSRQRQRGVGKPGAGGTASTEDSDHPALSRDGRFLAYEIGDRVALRDRVDGVTTVLATGREPAISGDGRFVAFTSVDGVMLLERSTRTVRNISIDAAGRAIANASTSPSLSGDGRYLAFASRAALTPAAGARDGDTTAGGGVAVSQVYVRDLRQGVTRLVSIGMGGKAADGDSWSPVISADGCALAFVSEATNLVKGDHNRSADVFLLNLVDGAIELVSRNAKGESGNGPSGRPAVSVDGQFVAFQSEASDLAKPEVDINLLWDVFMFDRRDGRVTRLSTDPGSEWMEASGGPAIDASGGVVAFSSRHPMNASDKRNDFDLFVLDGPSSYNRP